MDKGRFLIETHLRTGRPIAELAATHGVHRSWLYKLLARYRAEGAAGLEARSRRPHNSPARVADAFEEDIVELRKALCDAGFDAGAETIGYHLLNRRGEAPSTSTIWQVLKARGFVTPQPHKRPKSSWVRFVAEFPNECWQADVTHVQMADGSFCEVLNIVDDHSRLCVESRAFITTRSPDVVRALHRAAEKWGYPESFLTDNGAIFTSSMRGNDAGAIEPELLSLGIASKHSRPYHPQTCGKVERFHQTLKKHLTKCDPPETKRQLQAQLDAFVAYYNEIRPHRAIGRRPPIEAFRARERAHPRRPMIEARGYRIRHDKISRNGNVTLRYKGRLHHIYVGAAYKGWRVVLLVAGLEVRILTLEGTQLRRLKLDPTKDYQPL
ncbi:MAG: IS481 family transposase [Acidimicrobiia bacterium]